VKTTILLAEYNYLHYAMDIELRPFLPEKSEFPLTYWFLSSSPRTGTPAFGMPEATLEHCLHPEPLG
jgi:hypothetical protein